MIRQYSSSKGMELFKMDLYLCARNQFKRTQRIFEQRNTFYVRPINPETVHTHTYAHTHLDIQTCTHSYGTNTAWEIIQTLKLMRGSLNDPIFFLFLLFHCLVFSGSTKCTLLTNYSNKNLQFGLFFQRIWPKRDQGI